MRGSGCYILDAYLESRWLDAQADFRPRARGMALRVCQAFLDHVKHRRFQLPRKLGVSVRQFRLYLHATSLRKPLSVNAQCREQAQLIEHGRVKLVRERAQFTHTLLCERDTVGK